MSRSLFITFLTLLPAPNVFALTIRHPSQNDSIPFEITYQQGVQSSVDIVLQLFNDEDLPVSILSWQLDLSLDPANDAQGNLLFESVTAPADSLFGQLPGPLAVPPLPAPNDKVFIIDGDPDFSGVEILQQTTRNVVTLTLVADPDAAGAFQLVTPQFDPLSPDAGSSWFPSGELEPRAFGNAYPSELSGHVLLGTVYVLSVPEPTSRRMAFALLICEVVAVPFQRSNPRRWLYNLWLDKSLPNGHES